MDLLKKLFPFSFKVKSDVVKLLINILVQFLVAVGIGILIGVLAGAGIPVISWLFGIIGGLLDIYLVVGIVLSLLYFFEVIK